MDVATFGVHLVIAMVDAIQQRNVSLIRNRLGLNNGKDMAY